MIDKATVKRILDTADIVEVVSDYVHLTRRGANFMGLCPFHNERTPSFSVSPSRGICHCFSCGKGGSPVNFIMEKEGINFHDALLRLAEKYGIKVEERELSEDERKAQSEREAMLNTNAWAMKRFQENMNATEEGRTIGLEYFFQRGITRQAIDKFKLGYALDSPSDIYNAAIRQGYDKDVLLSVGLCGIGASSNRPYDRFRGRVIYPMINSAGKVIAFGGRGIKGEPAKYINSPESDIYHKSNELYGIYQAKNAIIRHKKCFLVEGYMDVIGMWQSGMENTVASSGTSLTDGQVALIHRFTDNITIIYDGDSAGINASLRAIDICLAQNIDVKLLLLPEGEDPDSYARSHTPEQFRTYIAEHEQDFITFKAGVYSHAGATTTARAEALKSMVTSIAHVSDLISRTVYIQKCSALMHVAEAVLTAEVSRARESVVQAQRKRRQLSRLAAADTTSIGQDSENARNYAPTGTPSDVRTETADPTSPEPKRHLQSLLNSVETQVMQYVVRYGMHTFCQAMDENAGDERWINVAEYVRDEMTLDNMKFENAFYDSLFARIIEMIPVFKEQYSAKLKEIDAMLESEHKVWLEDMQSKSLSISQIESYEDKYREETERRRTEVSVRYECEWIGNELGSDPDDDTRKFVLNAIIPRYTLSKYHSKNMHIDTEQERLEELLPRAIVEWKDALLLEKRKEMENELRAAGIAGDMEKMREIMLRMQENATLRSQTAKNLGERILIPRR